MAQSTGFTKPVDFFGFEPGSDQNLFSYEKLIHYLEKLDTESARLKLEEIGTSPMGKPMYIAFISSEEKIENMETLKVINRELALTARIEAWKLQSMISDGKVFVLATLSMLSSEVGPPNLHPLLHTILCQLPTQKRRNSFKMLYI